MTLPHFAWSKVETVITVKVPQMFQIANYGLCLTHCFETRSTLGFIFGWNMNTNKTWMPSVSKKRPWYLDLHGPRITNIIKSETSNWSNPLLLPVILLEDHIYNADRCKGLDLSRKTTKLEGQLQVTKAGRIADDSGSVDFEKLSKDMINKRLKIITDINTTITDVVTFAANLKWDCRYCQFLRDTSKSIESVVGATQGERPHLNNSVEVLATLVVSILDHADALKARLDVQLDVVRDSLLYLVLSCAK